MRMKNGPPAVDQTAIKVMLLLATVLPIERAAT
jgi:hypothetical protein